MPLGPVWRSISRWRSALVWAIMAAASVSGVIAAARSSTEGRAFSRATAWAGAAEETVLAAAVGTASAASRYSGTPRTSASSAARMRFFMGFSLSVSIWEHNSNIIRVQAGKRQVIERKKHQEGLILYTI